MVTPLIDACHECYGHVGIKKCWKLLSDEFYAPKLQKRKRQRIASCDSCQRNKIPNQTCYANRQNILPDKSNQILSIDYFRNNTTNITISKIFIDYVPWYGKPEKILCDQGTQFTSHRWVNKLKSEDIKCVFTSIRHPQANPVERVNRELGRFFRTLTGHQHQSWVQSVPIIQDCIDEVHHESTGYTPKEL